MIKSFVANILSNNFTGTLIGFLYRNKLNIKGVKIVTKSKHITSKTKSDIFWRIYESAEMRFINKYFDGALPLIELGSSIGVVSCYGGKRKGENLQICVEANPNLISVLNENINVNQIEQVYILNGAIGSNRNEFSFFDFGKSNILGKIKDTISDTKVRNIYISDILSKNNIEEFYMVCDIEGAEYFLFSQQSLAFEKCKLLIIELHDFIYNDIIYTVEDIKKLINNNTKLRYIENYGNVYVYKN